ncbi:NUDIX domain-containing protein [Streptomyces sp. B6B3]|uniref:NUDIX domain-containing protein n=1 Tax=Streptomyces sp. B6B3 TaxID=3153570 RepID=UPI00325E455A
MTWNTMKLPVSVKGIVFEEGEVWLRRNERQEWELPGGKLDPGEQPVETVERELKEEMGMVVRPIAPVHAYRHTIPGSADEENGVLVISYLCEMLDSTGDFETEGESGAASFRRFALDALDDGVSMPRFYVEAIRLAESAAR